MQCYFCHRTVEPVRGSAINPRRMSPVSDSDEYGQQQVFVALVEDVLVHQCEGCDWWSVGYEVDGVYLEDADLYPATGLLRLYAEYEQRQQRNRQPRPDPGE